MSKKKSIIIGILAGMILSGWFIGCAQKADKHKFMISAHRGASGWAPENTLAAFKKAIEMKSDYSELDVHLSKDGQVVLMHDDSLRRTTGTRAAVWDLTLADLKHLDAGSWFAPEFKGEPIPTLTEVIRLVKGKMKLNIEIKISRTEPDIAQKVIDIVRAEKFTQDVMITSFDKATVEQVLQLAPELPVGFIFNEKNTVDVFAGAWPILSSKYTLVDAEFVKKARMAGKKIHAWTVNDEATMSKLVDLRIDGIITNYPDRLVNVLQSHNPAR
jgi:glycerophosphoryl diester phosphodiesterase